MKFPRKKRSAQQLNAQIDRLIEIEIEKARKRAEEEARRKAAAEAAARKAAAAKAAEENKKEQWGNCLYFKIGC